MRNERQRPGPGAFWDNLRRPGPIAWKLRRLAANNLTKLRRRQECCGHPGEPGC